MTSVKGICVSQRFVLPALIYIPRDTCFHTHISLGFVFPISDIIFPQHDFNFNQYYHTVDNDHNIASYTVASMIIATVAMHIASWLHERNYT